MRTEEQVPPEFVGDIHWVIRRQASSKLSNFRVVRDIAARLEVQYSPAEIPFGQKCHDVHGTIRHFTVHFLSSAFKESVVPIDLEDGNDKLRATTGVFRKLASQLPNAGPHGVSDCHAFGRTDGRSVRFSERSGATQKEKEGQERASFSDREEHWVLLRYKKGNRLANFLPRADWLLYMRRSVVNIPQ
jgi:hypothetical protein